MDISFLWHVAPFRAHQFPSLIVFWVGHSGAASLVLTPWDPVKGWDTQEGHFSQVSLISETKNELPMRMKPKNSITSPFIIIKSTGVRRRDGILSPSFSYPPMKVLLLLKKRIFLFLFFFSPVRAVAILLQDLCEGQCLRNIPLTSSSNLYMIRAIKCE